MAYTSPTIAAFKAYFNRDFPYGSSDTTVMDTDIVRAQSEAYLAINQDLFIAQDNYTQGSLYLTAHYLVVNLQTSSQGIAGQYSWLQTAKSVGSVSEGFQIPQRILDNPEFAALTKTQYGTRYLMMILPLLSGVMFTACGRTNP